MRMHPYLKTLALALPLAVVANSCILIPEIKDRIVELAVGHSTILHLVASGSNAVHNDSKTINLGSDLNLTQLLSDNGLSANKVKDVKLRGVSYRVTKAQAGRSITNGTVEFLRHSISTPSPAPGATNPTAGYTQLVTAFTASVNSTTGWITVPLASAGVTEINTELQDLLNEAKGLGAAPKPYITYHVNGTTTPAPPPDVDFTYDLKLDLTIVGTFKTKVVN